MAIFSSGVFVWRSRYILFGLAIEEAAEAAEMTFVIFEVMPRNPASDARKEHVAKRIRERVGPLVRPHPTRLDWYSTKDDRVHVFITDSKAHYNKRPWFDMKLSDINELADYSFGFVIFVLGSETNFLVIPATTLKTQLKNYQPGQKAMEEGRYHFNLHGESFEQLPNWKLRSFRDNLEPIPKIL